MRHSSGPGRREAFPGRGKRGQSQPARQDDAPVFSFSKVSRPKRITLEHHASTQGKESVR